VLGTVKDEGHNLRRIIELLLFLARADAESSPPSREAINLCAWLDDYSRGWQTHSRAGDIHFVHPPDAVTVATAPMLLMQLLNTLVDNACKYSEPGTSVTVRLETTEDRVELSVEDEGLGIRPEDQSELFTPFFRSADVRRRGIDGFGLGLSIAKRLATVLGGDLTVSTELGRGSCFNLTLPPASRTEMSELDQVVAVRSTHA
jgi:signal transduction histidine kinase